MNPQTLWLDIKYIFRQLRGDPGFALLSTAALAVGIGLVTAMFTVVDGTILKGPDFPAGDDLKVVKWEIPKEGMHAFVRIQDFNDLAEQQEVFEDLAFWEFHGVNLRAESSTRSWAAARVSSNFTAVLGLEPILGRGFLPGADQPGADRTLLLGHRVWKEQFGMDEGVVGETVTVNGHLYTIVGVMPEGFRFPIAHDIWMPYQEDRYKDKRSDADLVWVFGYLRDGVSLERAKMELDQIAGRLAEAYPESNELYRNFRIIPFIKEFMDQSEEILLAMLGAVVLVLIIACTNVANLILAKSVARSQELAIRRSLGATRGRMIAQILTETLAVTLIGGLLGTLLAVYILDWFRAGFAGIELPFWFDFSMSWKTVGVVLLLITATALLAGLYPAWSASRMDINPLLADQSRGSSGVKIGRFNRSLIIMQISLSLAALIGAIGMLRASLIIAEQEFAFNPDEILQAQIMVSSEQIPRDPEVVDFYRELDRRLEEQPGVEFVAQTSSNAMIFPWTSRVRVEGKDYGSPEDAEVVQHEVVSWDYFRSLGIPILEGRDFLETDGDNMAETEAEVEEWIMIVNRTLADRFWPGESPIGKRVRDTWRTDSPWVRVVGVIPDQRFNAYGAGPDTPHMFRVSNQAALRDATIFLKVSGEPTAFIPTLERIAREVNPDIVAREPMTVAARIDRNMRGITVTTSVFALSGLVALFLGAIGIYGVVSFASLQRTREFGIRLALGATPRLILHAVLKTGFWQLAIGVPIGVLIGFSLLQAMSANIQGIQFSDPLVFLIPVVCISVVSMVAAFYPALRASRINPNDAIRDL